MKLEKILSNLNSFEKNSFLKIIDGLIDGGVSRSKEIQSVLSDGSRDLKSADNLNVSKVFHHLDDEFIKYIKAELGNTTSQLDVLVDIISRDGNCIMKYDWFARLYEHELKSIRKRVKELDKTLVDPKSEIDEQRKRDYRIYKACLETA